jgi:phosphate transport system ATP-binding protein
MITAPAQLNGAHSIQTKDLNLWYGSFQALKGITVSMKQGIITSLIGPSGCGKTTLLRCFNRINERYGNVITTGEITVLGKNIYDDDVSISQLRRSVGMVFQRPNPMPISIYDNVLFGVKVHTKNRSLSRSERDGLVERSLREVDLWDHVKDNLSRRATHLSLEQQQKLCIARLLPLKPRVILMDEPCSALDPISTLAIEDLIEELKLEYTIVIVTHNMQQASRVSDRTAFFNIAGTGKPGKLIEFNDTKTMFSNPSVQATEDYVSGKFG